MNLHLLDLYCPTSDVPRGGLELNMLKYRGMRRGRRADGNKGGVPRLTYEL